jgi:hypothetical protein
MIDLGHVYGRRTTEQQRNIAYNNLHDPNGPSVHVPATYAEETIMFVCSDLITIINRGGHQVVQISHFSESVKEYLTLERLAAAAEECLSYYHILPTLFLIHAIELLNHKYDLIAL